MSERNKKYWVACGDCGTVFDLRKANKCKHVEERGYWTKECPNCGGCICDKIESEDMYEEFREATEEERKHGFKVMLKEEYGGVKEEEGDESE